MDSRRESIFDEDEAGQILQKFIKESLDPSISCEEKIIHVWRWFADAEYNCKFINTRLEKMQKQHLEEIEEIIMTNKDLEIEIKRLNAELENENEQNAEIVSEEINEMLKRQGLKDLLQCGVSEQFAFLLVDRAQMKEELAAAHEKLFRKNHTFKMASKLNLTDNLKLSSPQVQQLLELQKDEFEEEFRNQQQMVRQLKEELREVHEQEMEKIKNDKQNLLESLKLAHMKIEELVRLLSKKAGNDDSKTTSWLFNILNCDLEKELNDKRLENDVLKNLNINSEKEIAKLNEKLKKAEKSNKMLELENQNLDFKLSELFYQCNEMEEAVVNERQKSRRPSIVRSSSIFESQSQINTLHGLFDRKISSAHQDLNLVDQVKRLKLEIMSLQNQLHSQGDQHELILRKYHLSKVRHREKLERIRDIYQKDKKSFNQQVQTLKDEIELQRLCLSQEKEVQNKLKSEIKEMIAESNQLSKRVVEMDVEKKDLTQRLEINCHRIKFYESENAKYRKKIDIRLQEMRSVEKSDLSF